MSCIYKENYVPFCFMMKIISIKTRALLDMNSFKKVQTLLEL